MAISRRDFVRLAGGASAAAAFAQMARTAALADTGDYRAMVGIFLLGGNDGWNTVVPTDSRYDTYAQRRGSTLALKQSVLVPLAGTPFGLHPSLAPLQSIWNEGAMNVVLNAGALLQPLTRSLYLSRPDLAPASLMSHQDQQNAWQGMHMRGQNLDGFLGRINDSAPASDLPSLISTGGASLALLGGKSSPLILPGVLARNGYYPTSGDAAIKARQAAIAGLADASAFGAVTDLTSQGMSTIYNQNVAASALLATASTVDSYFVDENGVALTSDIAKQLTRAARMIEARGKLGHAKQSFFITQGSYDTHAGQVDADTSKGAHATLLKDYAQAVAAFYKYIKAVGLSRNVTTFTMSDFGRVFQGNSQRGSDHAWGSNHLVIGGGLKAAKVHGRYPDMTFGGEEDATKDGRWIPSIAVEEYVGAIAQWYGVSASDMPYVFPNWSTWSSGGRGPVPFFS